MKESEYTDMLCVINENIGRLWPCPMSMYIGYILCPLTLGLSFLLPNICVAEAEKAMVVQLDYYNEYRFVNRGLKIKLVKFCMSSWIELHILDDAIDKPAENVRVGPKNYFRDSEGQPLQNTASVSEEVELMNTPGSAEDEVTFDSLLQEAMDNSIADGEDSELESQPRKKRHSSGKKVKKSPLKESLE